MFKRNPFFTCLLLVAFSFQSLGMSAHAQEPLRLPAPGSMIDLSPLYAPVLVKGLKVHPENPLLFDFIVDTGNSGFKVGNGRDRSLENESTKLIKYFLAALTLPEDDMWVNLSPYEKDRIVPEELGKTELGRDMLAQDYILKQLTSSLIYPEKQLGKEFWNRVYTKAQQVFGTTVDIPVNTFNKVWIVADKAKVLERNNAAFVVGAHLRVMLEEDYLATKKHDDVGASLAGAQNIRAGTSPAPTGNTNNITSQIIRDIVLPELEKEVNGGQNFASLRQMFYSMILASWYKVALKDAFLNQVYSNKVKTSGVLTDDPKDKEKIYQQYLQAYKKGVFNYIKEDFNTVNNQSVPRKYFSGGVAPNFAMKAVFQRSSNLASGESQAMAAEGQMAMVETSIQKADAAMGLVLNWILWRYSGKDLDEKLDEYLKKQDRATLERLSTHKNEKVKERVNIILGITQSLTGQLAASLEPGQVGKIPGGKVTIQVVSDKSVSVVRVIQEISGALDRGELTLDFLASHEALGMYMSQFGIGFAPINKHLMRFATSYEPDIQVMNAATRSIVEISMFDDYDQIADQVYRISWSGLDKQRHGLWLVFPKEDEGEASSKDPNSAMSSLRGLTFAGMFSLAALSTSLGNPTVPPIPQQVALFSYTTRYITHQESLEEQERLKQAGVIIKYGLPAIPILVFFGMYLYSREAVTKRTINQFLRKEGLKYRLRRVNYYDYYYDVKVKKLNVTSNFDIEIGRSHPHQIGEKLKGSLGLSSTQTEKLVDLLTNAYRSWDVGYRYRGIAISKAQDQEPRDKSAAMMSIEEIKLIIKDKRFLIVDDDPSNLTALRRTLKSFGVVESNIIQASNGKEAMEKLAQGGIDAVISDMNMPEMDGYQLAKHMKDTNTKIPIVIVSGRAEDYVSQFQQLGVPLLSKPCDIFVLMGKVAEMINANAAMSGPGGIDLNAKHMGMDVIKEGKGIEMTFDPAMLAEFQKGDFTGVVPNILRITPITSVLPIFGLS